MDGTDGIGSGKRVDQLLEQVFRVLSR
ncbi:hypothetical protein MTBUT4_20145 [Magnetospirillum sp. UT-4]|nr:hypothetical protein MTBUT4_20145 [Magnetospirillum sp. UT-4]